MFKETGSVKNLSRSDRPGVSEATVRHVIDRISCRFSKKINLEVDTDDVQERQELAIDELMEMHEQEPDMEYLES
ncbi:hypothetical protein TNCV_4122621 [Trichonephila clavipes]|nr:hypothetical protein TNCV_4122621 [Trichonephila clavipes]